MKFGFSAITDEAREKLEELSIRHQRQAPPSHGWDVYTETFDSIEEEMRERYPTLESIGALPKDVRNAYTLQGTRFWKNPHTGNYYYMFKEWIFKGERRIKVDHSTPQPTQFDFLILDLVPKDDQDRWRDILMSHPANADTAAGGVLI